MSSWVELVRQIFDKNEKDGPEDSTLWYTSGHQSYVEFGTIHNCLLGPFREECLDPAEHQSPDSIMV